MTTPSFPSSPATNDTVVRGDTTYKFNGYAWIPQSTGGSTSIFRVFYEVDFTAQTAQTVTGTTTLQGTSFFATLPSGSSISIGAYGLRMQSSSTPECNFGLLAGELPGLVGVKNLLRAKFAQWMHYGG